MTRAAAERGRSSVRVSAVRLLTLTEAASLTGRNAELLRRWCVSGRIRCQRVGRDWLVDHADLAIIEGMPRRGVTKRAETAVDNLDVLGAALRDAVEGCLEEGERIHVVIPGVEDSAIIVTDRKVLVARDGVLVTEPEHGRVAVWPLDWTQRVQLTTASATGALVLTPADPEDRALVLLLGRPHLARAEAAATELRRVLHEANDPSAATVGT